MKLLTAAAVLRRLGAEAHLETKAVAGVAPRDGVVAGDLWLVGGGDPLSGTADYAGSFEDQPRLFSDLGRLADDVVKAGVRTVEGRVIGDDSRYDTERYVPTWKPVYAIDGDVGPLSALAVNDGFVSWKPKSVADTGAGRPRGGGRSLSCSRRGACGSTGDPSQGAAPARRRALATLRRCRSARWSARCSCTATTRAPSCSSRSWACDSAGSGTTAAGVGVVRKTLAEAGIDVGSMRSNDGSGLDPTDRVSCATLRALLSGTAQGRPVTRGLAVAGTDRHAVRPVQGHRGRRPPAGRRRGRSRAWSAWPGSWQPGGGPVGGHPHVRLPRQLVARVRARHRGKRITERLGVALAAYPDAPPRRPWRRDAIELPMFPLGRVLFPHTR